MFSRVGLDHLHLDVLLALLVEDGVETVEVGERSEDLTDVLLAMVAKLLVLLNHKRLKLLQKSNNMILIRFFAFIRELDPKYSLP